MVANRAQAVTNVEAVDGQEYLWRIHLACGHVDTVRQVKKPSKRKRHCWKGCGVVRYSMGC